MTMATFGKLVYQAAARGPPPRSSARRRGDPAGLGHPGHGGMVQPRPGARAGRGQPGRSGSAARRSVHSRAPCISQRGHASQRRRYQFIYIYLRLLCTCWAPDRPCPGSHCWPARQALPAAHHMQRRPRCHTGRRAWTRCICSAGSTAGHRLLVAALLFSPCSKASLCFAGLLLHCALQDFCLCQDQPGTSPGRQTTCGAHLCKHPADACARRKQQQAADAARLVIKPAPA